MGNATAITGDKGFGIDLDVVSGAPSTRFTVEVFEAVDSEVCGGGSFGRLKTDKTGSGTATLTVLVPSLGDGSGTARAVIRLRPKFVQRGEVIPTYAAVLALFEAKDTEPPVLTLPDDLQVVASSAGGAVADTPEIAAFLAGATAVDDSDPSPTIVNDAPAVFPLGMTVVTFTAPDAAGNSAQGSASVEVVPHSISVDIRPGSDKNPLNLKSRGLLPVAVLSTDGFSATSVDGSSAQIAGATAVRSAAEDVDGDGVLDLKLWFDVPDLDLAGAKGDQLTLELQATVGPNQIPASGTDTVTLVGGGK